MIFTTLNNLEQLENIPHYEEIRDFIDNHDLNALEPGKIAFSDELYANVDEYDTEEIEDRKFEMHKIYGDVQIIISGEEKIGVSFPEEIAKITEENQDGDCYFNEVEDDAITYLTMNAGCVAFFPPTFPHRPCCNLVKGESRHIKKIVFKIQF